MMGYEFLYVFNEQDRDKLIQSGFVLMKSDEANSVYIFKTKDEVTFSDSGVDKYYLTDVLTF